MEKASAVRRFSIMFTLMSLLPLVLLGVAFHIFMRKGEIKLNSDVFFWTVFLVGLFVIVGFFSLRRTFVNLMNLSEHAKEIVSGNFSKRLNVKSGADNEVTELAKAFNGVVQQLESNIKELERSRGMLQSVLLKVASGVSSSSNIGAFLDLILETTVNALDGLRGLLLVVDDKEDAFVIESSCGLGGEYPKGSRLPIEGEVAGWVVRQRKPLLIPRLHKIASAEAKLNAFEPPLISTPLIFQNRVMGAVVVSGKKDGGNFVEDEVIILSNLSAQVALAMENARLNADNQKTYLETVTALALAVEARDLYSRGHSDRVSEYAVRIAETISLNAQTIKTIKEAAQLHDVGKIGISDDILRKPDVLNDVETKIIQQHPVIGEGIIIPLHGFSHLRDPIRHHHEWLNGEGYPDRLKDKEISLEARILTVADSFDAMTTDRPYRKGLTHQEAREELRRYKGTRFDERIVEALITCMKL